MAHLEYYCFLECHWFVVCGYLLHLLENDWFLVCHWSCIFLLDVVRVLSFPLILDDVYDTEDGGHHRQPPPFLFHQRCSQKLPSQQLGHIPTQCHPTPRLQRSLHPLCLLCLCRLNTQCELLIYVYKCIVCKDDNMNLLAAAVTMRNIGSDIVLNFILYIVCSIIRL